MDGQIRSPHQITGERNISIGKGTIIWPNVILAAWTNYGKQHFSPSIEIGENCNINECNQISACNKIKIGNNVLTGRYVYISDNSHGDSITEHISMPPLQRPLVSKGCVVIEDNVWIGERACILSGVTIGTGAIIAANTVVTHDVPAYTVAAGVPAKVVKQIKKDSV